VTATVHLHLWGSLGVQLAGYLYFVQQVHYEPNNLRLCLMTLHSNSDLDVDPELQMTVQEFVNIDKDLLTSQDVSDVNIIESVISDISEDSQTEEVQLTCKQVTDSLNIVIKFFEMESSTVGVESDMAKLFYKWLSEFCVIN
jgi:hypothetical protein